MRGRLVGSSLRDAAPPKSRKISQPLNLEQVKEEWAENLKRVTAVQFRKGGSRICLPLSAGDRWLGYAVLADRVNGLPYTIEELDLSSASGIRSPQYLLNLRLTDELMPAKELEAFQTMSTFFVHDLKNATSTLSLTLQNLPAHFDNPSIPRGRLASDRQYRESNKSAHRPPERVAKQARTQTHRIRPQSIGHRNPREPQWHARSGNVKGISTPCRKSLSIASNSRTS